MGNKGQVGYPSDVSDEEWAFVAPYLGLCREDAAQRSHSLRAVFNALRWLVKTGAHWRMMPNDLPPWPVVYQQTRRWIRAGCFEIMVEDLRSLLREFAERKPQPTAMVVDSRTVQSTPESGARGDTTAPSGAKGPRCMQPLTLWATCLLCMSQPPTSRTAPRWKSSPKRCSGSLLPALTIQQHADHSIAIAYPGLRDPPDTHA